MATPTPIQPAQRSEEIQYAVRDVVLIARKAAAAGRTMSYLNIGDPLQYDFATPAHVVEAMCQALKNNHNGYAASEGVPAALAAIRADAEQQGIQSICDAFVGNGASECIDIALSALVNPGDNVLLPRPGYPLYSAILAKLGAIENPYYLIEENSWQPDPAQVESCINDRTRAIVLINPNNPTGAVCERRVLQSLLEVAAKHRLVVFADEIYAKLILDPNRPHVPLGSLRNDLPILTFNGLSKAYLGTGLRIGWCVSSGPITAVGPLVDAMHKFLRARLCASMPAQMAIPAALQGDQSHISAMLKKLVARRDLIVNGLNNIPGISCVSPPGAFYAFPRLHDCDNDEIFVKQLIAETGVVVVHGSGFGQAPKTAHFRVVFLPQEPILQHAIDEIARFVRNRSGASAG